MKLEQQVVSLELAKKMKELGAPQESLFYWVRWLDFGGAGKFYPSGDVLAYKEDPLLKPKHYTDGELYAAYTVAELGEMLPAFYRTRDVGRLKGHLHKDDTEHWWECSDNEGENEKYADTEANARGKMWIYLKEHNLLPE